MVPGRRWLICQYRLYSTVASNQLPDVHFAVGYPPRTAVYIITRTLNMFQAVLHLHGVRFLCLHYRFQLRIDRVPKEISLILPCYFSLSLDRFSAAYFNCNATLFFLTWS